MSVKVKTILLTAITLFIMGGGIFLLSRDYLIGHFASLESVIQRKDIESVSKSIDRTYNEIGSLAVDWAVWDETDQFLQGNNPEFIEEYFVPETFSSLGIDLVVLADKQGRTQYAARFAQDTSTLHAVNGEAAAMMLPGGVFWEPGTEVGAPKSNHYAGGNAVPGNRSGRLSYKRGWTILRRYLIWPAGGWQPAGFSSRGYRDCLDRLLRSGKCAGIV